MDPIIILNGIFTIILVAINTIVGIIIVLKYFKSKNRSLLFIGITWIILGSPWWPASLSFIYAIFTGDGFSLAIYLLIGNVFVPIYVFFLVATFSETYFLEKQKIILIGIAIFGIIIEIILFYYLFTDPSQIGDLKGILDIEFSGFILYYLILVILLTLVLGCLISIASIRSDNPKINLRGKFLLLAFISWSIGAICDARVPLTFITVPIIRILLISSAIEFYIGFILPDFIKKRFINEK